jgi:hypothetical protein
MLTCSSTDSDLASGVGRLRKNTRIVAGSAPPRLEGFCALDWGSKVKKVEGDDENDD